MNSTSSSTPSPSQKKKKHQKKTYEGNAMPESLPELIAAPQEQALAGLQKVATTISTGAEKPLKEAVDAIKTNAVAPVEDFFHTKILPAYNKVVANYELARAAGVKKYEIGRKFLHEQILPHPVVKTLNEDILQPHVLPKVKKVCEIGSHYEKKLATEAETWFDSPAVRHFPSAVANKLEPYLGPSFAHYMSFLEIDSPVTLVFAILCVLVHFLATSSVVQLIAPKKFGFDNLQQNYFSVHPWQYWAPVTEIYYPLLNYYYVGTQYSYLPLPGVPWSFFRLFTHVLGHGDWQHLSGNLVNLLLAGPSAEREFGSYNLLKVIVYVAVFSAFAHMFFGHPQAIQLGASGVVFMTILLSSLVQLKLNKVPVTFVLQMLLWVHNEVVDQIFATTKNGGASNIAHLSGALVGTVFGFRLHGEKLQEKVKAIGLGWLKKAKEKTEKKL
ncbi:unnamed protein product [Amoebophrya sp. A120]|nr:unnamed protein product [Amoebophrya sp. A120]|eukprot:GSA120T00017859001.1